MSNTFARRRALLTSVSAMVGVGAVLSATAASAIVPNNNFNRNQPPVLNTTPNVNGVGQMVLPFYNSTFTAAAVGTCTGTLINPRVVIFAAHCVNGQPNTTYGPGGQPIGFQFNANNLAPINGQAFNNPRTNFLFGQPTVVGNQIQRGPRNVTNVAQNSFNVNFVWYDPRSLETARRTGDPEDDFFEADIALATLDTPTPNRFPTWTLLFSPLTGSTHVTITGYGLSGDGTNGSFQPIDSRRRSAENILNALISFDDLDRAFGFRPSGLPQDVYFFDFDDPARGTPNRNRFDADFFRDGALPVEGTTAGGDSGGPLIVDQRFTQPVVAGVLSGGGAFFAQPPNSYGEISFFQPLFLFWDVIVANNPYRYVTANPGDGDWFDASRWTQQMDPAYAVIENGQLRNGLPTTPALGVSGVNPGFGNVCNGPSCTAFGPPPIVNPGQGAPASETGEGLKLTGPEPVTDPALSFTSNGPAFNTEIDPLAGVPVAPALDAEQGPADPAASLPESAEDRPAPAIGAAIGRPSNSMSARDGTPPPEIVGPPSSQVDPRAPAPPPATTPGLRIAGGPGSTNFVPNNVDPNRATNTRGNYYDVTLSNAGLTTLGGNANAALRTATVDRFTMASTGAVLNITGAGSLTSLIDTTILSGRLNVDGRLATPEFLLAAGMLSGSGTIRTDFLTSIMGVIAPGGVNTVGTLTVDRGSVILASGNQLLIDVGASGSDLLRVTCARTSTAANAPCVAGSGVVNLGGLVGFNFLGGASAPQFGQEFTFISADGPVTGRFSAMADNLPGLLRAELIFSANAVQFRIAAGQFRDFVDPNSDISGNFARQLDLARTNPASVTALRELFTAADVLEGEALTRGLESLAPYATVTTSNLVRTGVETFEELVHHRVHAARKGQEGVEVMGSPLAVLQTDPMSTPDGTAMTDAPQPGLGMATAEGVTAFIAGGYSDGEADPLRNTVFDDEKESLKSVYVAAGLEKAIRPDLIAGVAAAYTDGEGDFAGDLSKVETKLFQLGVYGGYRAANGLFVDGHAGVGFFDAETVRRPRVGAAVFEARDDVQGKTGTIGLAAGFERAFTPVIMLTPMASLTYHSIGIEDSQERGGSAGGPVTTGSGAAALTIRDRRVEALIGRVSVKASADYDRGGYRITPQLKVGLATDFIEADQDSVIATLTGSPGAFTNFDGPDRDKFWVEAAAGVGVQGPRLGFHVSYSTDFSREDLETNRVNASVSFKF